MSKSGNAQYKEKMPRAVQIYPCQCDFCSHHTRCCRASQTLTKTDLYAWYEFWQKPCNSNFISCSYITVSHNSRNVPMPLTSNCFKLYVFIFNTSNQYITLMRTHIYTCLFVSTDLIMRIPWESFLALSRKA